MSAMHQRDMSSLTAILAVFREKPLDKATNGRNAGIDCNQDCVGQRLPQCKQAVRAMELHGLTRLEIAQKIREKAAFYAVQAYIYDVALWRRGNGICPRLLLAASIFRNAGDELARNKIKF